MKPMSNPGYLCNWQQVLQKMVQSSLKPHLELNSKVKEMCPLCIGVIVIALSIFEGQDE